MTSSKSASSTVACRVCDQLIRRPRLQPGERARCNRCGTQLTSHSSSGLHRCLALSSAALILLLCSLGFPVIGIRISGQSSILNLTESATVLFSNDDTFLGLVVIITILLIPALMLLLLIALCSALLLELHSSWWHRVGRIYFHIREWNMVEVYLLGLIVTLTKLVEMANVNIGLAFWALCGFCLCFIAAVYSLDRYHLWDMIREAG